MTIVFAILLYRFRLMFPLYSWCQSNMKYKNEIAIFVVFIRSYCCWNTASLHVRPHCANVRRIRRQADLNSFPLGELEETRTTWMKTTQQDLESLNLSINQAIDMAQNHALWRMMLMSTYGATHSWCMPEMSEWMNEWMNQHSGETPCLNSSRKMWLDTTQTGP